MANASTSGTATPRTSLHAAETGEAGAASSHASAAGRARSSQGHQGRNACRPAAPSTRLHSASTSRWIALACRWGVHVGSCCCCALVEQAAGQPKGGRLWQAASPLMPLPLRPVAGRNTQPQWRRSPPSPARCSRHSCMERERRQASQPCAAAAQQAHALLAAVLHARRPAARRRAALAVHSCACRNQPCRNQPCAALA